MSTVIRPIKFGILGFVGGRKTRRLQKRCQGKDKTQQQIQPPCDAKSRNQVQAMAMGGKPSHHNLIPAPCYSANGKMKVLNSQPQVAKY